MNSTLFLTFQDEHTKSDYNKKRHPEIIKLSILILVERIAFLLIIVANFLILRSSINVMRMVYFSVGIGIHIISLLSLKLNISWLYTLHAPIVILSHMLHTLNGKLSDDEVIAIYGQMIILIVAVMILNQNWIVTSGAIVVSFTSWCLYLGFLCDIKVGVIGP